MRNFINSLESKLNDPQILAVSDRLHISPGYVAEMPRPGDLQETQLSARFWVRAPGLWGMGVHVSHMWDCCQGNTNQIDGQNPSKKSRSNWLAKAQGQDQKIDNRCDQGCEK